MTPGQGVEMMMAGHRPCSTNFRQGGAVQFQQVVPPRLSWSLDNFDFGTEVKTQYESLLPIFQGIVGERPRSTTSRARRI